MLSTMSRVASSVHSQSALMCFSFPCHGAHRALHSFPTRRSSDLEVDPRHPRGHLYRALEAEQLLDGAADQRGVVAQDRKSTRLNSSHVKISYAVFCLKKKNPSCSDVVR